MGEVVLYNVRLVFTKEVLYNLEKFMFAYICKRKLIYPFRESPRGRNQQEKYQHKKTPTKCRKTMRRIRT